MTKMINPEDVKSSKLKKWMKDHYMPNNSTFAFRDEEQKIEWAEEHVNILISPNYRYR